MARESLEADWAFDVTTLFMGMMQHSRFWLTETVKGRGVSYMENVPIWHYRAPNKEEYQKAIV